MVWGPAGEQTRRVTVAFDEGGQPLNYTDVRGGLGIMRTRGEPVPGTAILLNWRAENALVQNQDGSGVQINASVEFREALVSETLGRPTDVVEMIWAMCADSGQEP